ncbi:MAG: hypothetical protein K2Q18_19455 [Bdellovibrionales bacterium]|nr:hypothetical protein [Bdellovibrionales bacterium]
MRIKNLFISLLVALTITSCGSKPSGKKPNTSGLPGTLEMGVSTTNEVEAEMGEPDKTYEAKDATMYNYDTKTIKIENNIVKGFFREPNKDEVHLQYWLQKWKNKKTFSSEMKESKNPHGQSEYQMNNSEERVTIIYNKENGIVKRVMFYEK